jgi:hypothetical protein
MYVKSYHTPDPGVPTLPDLLETCYFCRNAKRIVSEIITYNVSTRGKFRA